MVDGSVQGFAHDRFAPVRAAFEDNLTTGADVGASFCATVAGETVVDLWGGYADQARTRPWHRDTIVNVYSATKTMTALTALLVADRGELDFDAPVARCWPEFAANGKNRVTVGHLMSHTAGLSGWRETISVADLYDWEKVTALLAAQMPFWEPGTASGFRIMSVTIDTLGNQEAQRAAHQHIRGKVLVRADSGETDRRGHSVCEHPGERSGIFMSDHTCDRPGSRGMLRREGRAVAEELPTPICLVGARTLQ